MEKIEKIRILAQVVEIVLTAHPTQINRRTLQYKHIRIAYLLEYNAHADLSHEDRYMLIEDLICKMDLEARSLQQNVKVMPLAKLREYKSDLNNLKIEVKRMTSANFNQAARNDFLEAGLAGVSLSFKPNSGIWNPGNGTEGSEGRVGIAGIVGIGGRSGFGCKIGSGFRIGRGLNIVLGGILATENMNPCEGLTQKKDRANLLGAAPVEQRQKEQETDNGRLIWEYRRPYDEYEVKNLL
ncbi:hypothetical protein IFM89_011784 [Coptis chinensis]|uniref:Vesicle transport v-SNARE N-terminal domain-containing protein n=1 Tax=Coptis chinensis TaxID=261450 RepID=A0A835ME41_9MAGN|nr:hypothetical protein IFM89_011784 [Coptis chinensis]